MEEQPLPAAPAEGPVPEKIPPLVHVVCGWPLVLAGVGGVIGGALGGLAYGLNITAYRKGVTMPGLVGVSLIVGAAAIFLWTLVAGAL